MEHLLDQAAAQNAVSIIVRSELYQANSGLRRMARTSTIP